MYYAGQQYFEYAGSAGLHLRSGNAAVTLTLSMAGSLFDLFSIDLSILNPSGQSPPVTFRGHFQGGGFVEQTFRPTEFGFDQFDFLPNFRNLESVEWRQGPADLDAHQFDKIVVQAVPEPATLILIGLGALVAGVAARRRKL